MRAAQPDPTNSSSSAGSQRRAASRPDADLEAGSIWVMWSEILSEAPRRLLQSAAMSVLRIACVVLIAVVAEPGRLTAQAPEWFGTWSLNLQRSTYDPGPPPYLRASYTIAPSANRTI